MNSTDDFPLPHDVAVAITSANGALTSAIPSDVPTILYPIREAWLEAVESGERVDGFAIADAIPRLPNADVDAAVDAFLRETWSDAIRSIPIMLTFVEANPCRVLSGIRVLSFEAGKAGDEFEAWRVEAETALIWAMNLPEGPIPLRLDLLMDAMEDAFFDGRRVGGIEGDPLAAPPHPVYAARVAAAREAVAARLAETANLDELTADIRADFDVLDGDAWLAVEDVSRAAAVSGDLHAARLRSDQILGVHRWFVEHAEQCQAHGRLTIGTMVMADQSRQFLADMAA